MKRAPFRFEPTDRITPAAARALNELARDVARLLDPRVSGMQVRETSGGFAWSVNTLQDGGRVAGPTTFSKDVTFGDPAQSATVTVNFYGAPSFPTTINVQNNAVLVLIPGSSVPSSPATGQLYKDVQCGLYIGCKQPSGSTSFNLVPSLTSKPSLGGPNLKFALPPFQQTGPGNRTSSTSPVITMTDVNNNVLTRQIPNLSISGLYLNDTGTVYDLQVSDSGNVFDLSGVASPQSWRLRTWVYFVSVSGAAPNDLIGFISTASKYFRYNNVTNKLEFVVKVGGAGSSVAWSSTLSLNTLYSVECWFDGTAQTINISVNGGAAVSLNIASSTINSASGEQFDIQAALNGLTYYVGPTEVLYSVPSGTDLADWYNSGTPLSGPNYNTSSLGSSLGGTGINGAGTTSLVTGGGYGLPMKELTTGMLYANGTIN